MVDIEQSVLTDKDFEIHTYGYKSSPERPEQLRMSTMIAYLEATELSSDGLRLSTDLYRSYVNKFHTVESKFESLRSLAKTGYDKGGRNWSVLPSSSVSAHLLERMLLLTPCKLDLLQSTLPLVYL